MRDAVVRRRSHPAPPPPGRQLDSHTGWPRSPRLIAYRGGYVDRRRPRACTAARRCTARSRSAGAKNLVSKAMVAALLGERPEPAVRRAEDPRRRGRPRPAGAARRQGHRGPSGEFVFDPTNVGTGQRRRDQRARRVEPDPDPVLRPAAAPARPGVHPRPGRLPHRRPADRLPPRRAAPVRRGRRQDARRACTSPRRNGLHGTKFELPYPSVGATEQVLLTAVRAEGVTELRNAAVEPEIIDLICVLQKMGAIIKVHTDRVIEIEGVPRLRGYTHRPIPDRIEAASWACAALATGGDITGPRRPAGRHDDLPERVPLGRRRVRHRRLGDRRRRSGSGTRAASCSAVALETDVHPGFMTDWQQPLVVALTQARGLSIVHETVYERRLGYTEALEPDGRHHPGLPRLPGRHAVPVRPAQLPALGGDRRPEQAARGRPGDPRPAGRFQPPDRGAGRRGHLARVRGRA